MKDGNRHGYGKYTYTDGSLYEGNWIDDMKHGKGRIKYLTPTGYIN